MKTLTPDLAAHYASPTTTITTCWKVTRRDQKQFGYTALDRDVVVQGHLYSATVGVAASAIASSSDLSIQNIEVAGLFQEGLLALGAMTEDDIVAGVWDDARITIFEVNYRDPAMGATTLQTGTVGQMKTGRLTYTAELRGLMQHLQQNIGRTVTPGCDYDLGDENCKVDLGPFTVAGSVTGLVGGGSRRGFVDSALVEVDHWFAYGKITWLTGANAGLAMEVKDSIHDQTTLIITITLQSPMPYDIAIGDTYTMHAGCNKQNKIAEGDYSGDCGTKFDNVINKGGFDEVPGNDRVMGSGN
jgi:uncharacterized phage protein (TIGR02218 family)